MSTFKTGTAIFDFADDFSGSMIITEKRCPERIIEIDAKDLLEFVAQKYVKPRIIASIENASIDDLLVS